MTNRTAARPRNVLMLILLALLILPGCHSRPRSPDARLTELTREALTRQARQNEQMAEQAKSIADAAKELVTHDAEARREIVQATRELNVDLNSERHNLDRQHEELEDERRQLAAQRHRDPIIAAAIQSFGIIIACLLPLLVVVFVLRQLRDETGDDAMLANLLVREIVAEKPLLDVNVAEFSSRLETASSSPGETVATTRSQ